MKTLFLFLTFSLSQAAVFAQGTQPRTWTYFFYIAGDFYFEGPSLREDSRLKLEDQAHALYETVYQTAKSDKINNYAIFFDPKGRAAPFSDRHVRFRYVEKGRKVESNGIFEGEIDSTHPETFARFFREAKASIKSMPKTHTLFFYYGEHVPEVKPTISQDLSQPEGGLPVAVLASALSQSAISWDLQIYQSCSMNTVETVRRLAPLSRQLVLAEGLVSRTVLPGIDELLKSSSPPQDWTSAFLKTTQKSPFPHPFFEVPQRNFRDWDTLLDSFVRNTPIEKENDHWSATRSHWTELRLAESGQATGPLLLEAFQDPVEILSGFEHMVTLRDYVSLRSRTSEALLPEDELQALHKVFSDPILHKLRVRIPSP